MSQHGKRYLELAKLVDRTQAYEPTEAMTLLPGDVISTGTPSGVGPLAAGDVVNVKVERVGDLRNPVQDEPR